MDKLSQENKTQRVEQPPDLAWVVGLRKHQGMKQKVILLLPWSVPSSRDKIQGWSEKCWSHTHVTKPSLGLEGDSSAPRCRRKEEPGLQWGARRWDKEELTAGVWMQWQGVG